jgi:hypothetical protein
MHSGGFIGYDKILGFDDKALAGKQLFLSVVRQPGQLHQAGPVVQIGQGCVFVPGKTRSFRVKKKKHMTFPPII